MPPTRISHTEALLHNMHQRGSLDDRTERTMIATREVEEDGLAANRRQISKLRVLHHLSLPDQDSRDTRKSVAIDCYFLGLGVSRSILGLLQDCGVIREASRIPTTGALVSKA